MSVRFTHSFDDFDQIRQAEKLQEYEKWAKKIPYLTFPSNCEVQIIPPSLGAIVRFMVKRKDTGKSVSVYLDCYDRLGCVGKPYWEIYPYRDDVYRVFLGDEVELMEIIRYALGNDRKKLTKS